MKTKKKQLLTTTLLILLVSCGLVWLLRNDIQKFFFKPTSSQLDTKTQTPEELNSIRTVLENLDTPWSMAEMPDGELAITERSGSLFLLNRGAKIPIPEVTEQGEGGLLGIAVHPSFTQNKFIYVYMTRQNDNAVIRYALNDGEISDRTEILTGIPKASTHNGGEIKFGPDGMLYIATGDAANPTLAQDTQSLAGKILRVTDTGTVPGDNPFKNKVWSYGHRNPQGFTWDDTDRLWSTEHGPSGAESGEDELNLIQKGANYGWPIIRGDQTAPDMQSPVIHSGKNETWAPGGIAYLNGTLYFTGLRGEAVYKAVVQGNSVTLSRHLANTYGRLRAIIATDNELLISTSNRDGRGDPSQNDDHIYRVPLSIME